MTAHTKTPWYNNQQSDGTHQLVQLERDPQSYSAVTSHFETTKANAEFIVRCVNAHQALVDVLQNFVNGAESGAITSEFDETFTHLMGTARKVLSLARGESV